MIQVKPSEFNFGNLPINKQHKFSVTVTNVGNSKAIIDTKPYCSSCTTAKVAKHHLNPNESTTIDLVFTPSKIGGNHKTVGVLENSNEVAKISFTSNVV